MSQDADQLKNKWDYLERVPLPSFKEKPRILTGKLHCYLTHTRQTVETSPDKPMAFKCRLGWSMGGPDNNGSGKYVERCFHTCATVHFDDILHQMVKKNFSTEDFGVKITHEKPRSREDVRALELMKATTKRCLDEDRFETGLLWKHPDVELPESRTMAFHRLLCQEKKMDKVSAFSEVYCKKINEYLEKGFVRKLNPVEIPSDSKRVWYMPHFGVWNPNKP